MRAGRRGVPVHRHAIPQLLVDAVLVAAAYLLAFELRFDSGIPVRYDRLLTATLPWVVLGTLAILAVTGVYRRETRFTGRRDYEALIRGVVIATVITMGAVAIAHPVEIVAANGTRAAVGMPAGVMALYLLLALGFLMVARFAVHVFFERRLRGLRSGRDTRDVLIIGGGDGGHLVVREMVRNPALNQRPIGFVDDDPRKRGDKDEYGLRVLGGTDDLPRILDETEPDEVIIAIPSAPGELRARVVGSCRKRGIPVRTLPTVFELLRSGDGLVRQVRDVQVEDILGREPVRMELERVGAYLAGKTVMVTGAGGSVGAELCRQIARVGPRSLVLVDHAEDNLFEILRELEGERHVHGAVPVLADCREEERMREVMEHHRPSVIFHAAAYKHVGMMERNPIEAVRNNALATRLVAKIAGEMGVATFVLISTDKAVEPATVMGASKAMAEWAVEASAAMHPGTSYSAVRFGNVLGSSGSVVPIFRRQIAAGGPVTITDEGMTRFFMTIPEAVQLVIRAGSLGGRSGSIYVLDMGEPVRILDLAETMIRLSGLEPGRDIAIQKIGRRAGEKLHEQLFNPDERPIPTAAEKILRVERALLDPEWVERSFSEINLLALEADAPALAARVSELASTAAARASA